MTLNEAYPDWMNDRGVFSYLTLRNHFREVLTDEYIIRSLNGLLHGIIAGDFQCSKLITDFQLGYADSWQTYISDYINEIYVRQWMRAYEAFIATYDVSSPYNLTNAITTEASSTNTAEGTSDSKDNVYAYNANNTPSPTDESSATNTNTVTDSSNSTVTNITTGSAGTPMQDLLKKEIDYARYNFYRSICMDLKDCLTIPIL